MKNILIISHENCSDGLCASHVANTALKQANPEYNIHNIFMDHRNKSLDLIKQNKDLIDTIKNVNGLYVLDFSFNKEVLKYFFELNPNLIINIIDHHKTAQEEIDEVMNSNDELKQKLNTQLNVEFNNNYSGAVLSYVYFYLRKKPSLYHGEEDHKIPNFLKYIQDRDIWIWKDKPNSLPFTEIFFQKVKSLEECNTFFPLNNEQTINKYINNFIQQGNEVLNYKENQLKEIIKNKIPFSLTINNEKHNGYIINANGIFSSELGNRLSYLDDEHKFAIIWSVENNTIKCGLRSHNDFDCSVIAKYFGGGGHKNASAFSMNNLNDFVSFYNKLLNNEITITNENAQQSTFNLKI